METTLRVAIDISEIFSKVPGGGGQGAAIRSLIGGLARIDFANKYTLFSVRRVVRPSSLLGSLPENFQLVQVRVPDPRMLVLGWHLLRWPACESFIGEHDVVHATTPALVPFCRSAKLILTVHDLVWWRFPGGLRPWGRALIRRGVEAGAKEARILTTDSDATRQDVLAYLGNRIDPTNVRTIHIGIDLSDQQTCVSSQEEVLQRYGIGAPYLACLGTIEPRKNLRRLLEAYGLLPAEQRAEYQMVVIGPHGWKVPAMGELIASLGLERHVRWTGYVPEADRNVLLRGATALIYPSLYEGFGLPILEAFALGVPVVTSNVSSMPEVAGDAALLVDPTSTEALASALERVLRDEGLRRSLVARGHLRQQEFSSERMASQFLAVYEEVATTGCYHAARQPRGKVLDKA